LHAPDPVKDDEEDDSTSEVVTPITEDLHEASSGVEALDPTLPTMERHEFASLGFSVDLPLTWAVSEYKDSVSIRSDCEEVMIAVDRYTVGLMTADRAALGLQVTLNEQGFEQDQNGMIHYLAHLDPRVFRGKLDARFSSSFSTCTYGIRFRCSKVPRLSLLACRGGQIE